MLSNCVLERIGDFSIVVKSIDLRFSFFKPGNTWHANHALFLGMRTKRSALHRIEKFSSEKSIVLFGKHRSFTELNLQCFDSTQITFGLRIVKLLNLLVLLLKPNNYELHSEVRVEV